MKLRFLESAQAILERTRRDILAGGKTIALFLNDEIKSFFSANSGETGKELLNLVGQVVTLSQLEEGEKTGHVIGVCGERGSLKTKRDWVIL